MGKDRSGLYEPAVQEYASRLAHYTRFELVELPEAGGKKGKAQDARALEADALLAKKKPQDLLVALDERGKLLDSVEFSRWVGRARDGSKDLLLVIGGTPYELLLLLLALIGFFEFARLNGISPFHPAGLLGFAGVRTAPAGARGFNPASGPG